MFPIGDVQLAAPVFLAPMSGVTDAPARGEADRFGAPAVVTEMVAGAELAREHQEFVRRAASHHGSGPFILQLAGRDPHWIRVGAELSETLGAQIIDINMGCPAKKVTGGQGGCALMREPALAKAMVAAAVAGTSRPVTVKMRLGWDESALNAPEIARIAEGEGARLITVHARTRQQFYSGHADWARVQPVVDSVNIPVIVNGDIRDTTTARQAMNLSGATGVMIGRAATGRPWLVGEISQALFGTAYTAPGPFEKLASLLRQIEGSAALYGESLGVRVVRKHVAAFVDAWAEDHHLPDPDRLRSALCRLDTVSELTDRLSGALSYVREAA